MKPAFRYVDLRAGIGGFRGPLDALGGECVLTCENDKFARETYLANWPIPDDHIFYSDVVKLGFIGAVVPPVVRAIAETIRLDLWPKY